MASWVLVFLCVFGSIQASIQKSVPVQRMVQEIPLAVLDSDPPQPPEITQPKPEEPIGLAFNAAYTYWYAGQEGLDIARYGLFLEGDDPYFAPHTTLLTQSFDYQSGFEVGACFMKDRWSIQAQYVWVANTVHQQNTAQNFEEITGVWVIRPWFLQVASDGGPLYASEVSSSWHLQLSYVDFVTRYLCCKSDLGTLASYLGLRGAWMAQTFNLTILETQADPNAVSYPVDSNNALHHQALGPLFGIDGTIALGQGFFMEGKCAGSLLWTHYPKILHSETRGSAVLGLNLSNSLTASWHNQTDLCPVVECGLGLGYAHTVHQTTFTLKTRYDFMLWWNQNKMRTMMNLLRDGSEASSALYLHGLTVDVEVGF